jgi:hypothetical protein
MTTVCVAVAEQLPAVHVPACPPGMVAVTVWLTADPVPDPDAGVTERMYRRFTSTPSGTLVESVYGMPLVQLTLKVVLFDTAGPNATYDSAIGPGIELNWQFAGA